ncbi:MAG: PEP-CTERM sorting domain-containing protein [Bryobacteraceae bacterium]|nr:PEP-CTERM sorting domain-containing protein [Bryobacteraceae bacterium]
MLLLGFVLLSSASYAASVGQWYGTTGTEIWSTSSNYSSIYAAATVAGHSFDPTAEFISQQSLAGNTHFIISNPGAAAQASEIGALGNWVRGGGNLLVFANPDGTTPYGSVYNALFINSILSGLGSSMSVNYQTLGLGSTQVHGTLGGADSSVLGIQGGGLAANNIYPVMGGMSVAIGGALLPYMVQYQNLDAGRIYVIGGNIAANSVISEGSNRQFLLNLLGTGSGFGGGGGGSSDPFADAPEPGTIALTAVGLLGALAVQRRRKKA